jgi:hypothetical protein
VEGDCEDPVCCQKGLLDAVTMVDVDVDVEDAEREKEGKMCFFFPRKEKK